MRLTPSERNIILKVILSLDPEAEVYLHGSRADDRLKGGDIDLLILSSRIRFSEKLSILAELKLKLGDQKIDLTISDPRISTENSFVSSILPNAIRI